MIQKHVEPPLTPIIKGKYNGKSDKDFVKVKLCIDPTPITLDLYVFRMSLFDNGNPEEICLFVGNFNMTLPVSGTLDTGAKFR